MHPCRVFLLLAVASGAAGCFDVHPVVGPDPLLLDDFTDSNGYPSNYHFERWQCRPVDGNHPIDDQDCNITADYQTDHDSVLHLGATLYPPGDLTGPFFRAEVVTYAAPGLNLLSPDYYSSFVLSAKLESRVQPAPFNPTLTVQLMCTHATTKAVSSNPAVLAKLEYTYGTWERFERNLEEFKVPEDLPADEKVKVQECLARVDGIKVTVDSSADTPSTFDLYVDDIWLEPRRE